MTSEAMTVSCFVLSKSRQSTLVGCHGQWTPARVRFERAVLTSPLVLSREMVATVHSSPLSGRGGRDGSGNKSVSLSKVPGEMTRYLTWFPIHTQYSLSNESSSSTDMDSMIGCNDGLAMSSPDIVMGHSLKDYQRMCLKQSQTWKRCGIRTFLLQGFCSRVLLAVVVPPFLF